MSLNYSLADLLTRIRNGQQAKLSTIETRNSRLGRSVLDVLQREGYIRGYKQDGRALNVELKYSENQPAIRTITCVSKPGRRVYSSVKDLPSVHNGLGITILSTPHGVMTDHDARKENVGGELLCEVF